MKYLNYIIYAIAFIALGMDIGKYCNSTTSTAIIIILSIVVIAFGLFNCIRKTILFYKFFHKDKK